MKAPHRCVALLAGLLMTGALHAGEVAFAAEMRLEALPAHAPEPSDNPATPAKIALGRLLFFDPILSATRTVACATCHHPQFAWADARATPLGVNGNGLGPARMPGESAGVAPLRRNVPSLLNVGFNAVVAGVKADPKSAPMFWDARVQGLEAQALHPIRSHDEMRGDRCLESEAVAGAVSRVRQIAGYRALFAKAFPDSGDASVGAGNLAKAIAAFERTLVAGNSPFDHHFRGGGPPLTSAQEHGLKIFQAAGCTLCHGGPMFSDFKLHFIGVGDSSPDGRREFRTPTLRNLRHTAPYMHHGAMRTLDEVLTFYEQLSDAVSETLDGGDANAKPALDPLLKQLDLNAGDFPDLNAFLEMLNDDGYDRTVPSQVPSGLPVPQ
jgi:cytochrome c peroxidase